MKIERETKEFKPVLITLESEKEVQLMNMICRLALSNSNVPATLEMAQTIRNYLGAK